MSNDSICLSRPTRAGGLVPAPGAYGFLRGSMASFYRLDIPYQSTISFV